MGHFCMQICQSVRLILKRKIHTGQQAHTISKRMLFGQVRVSWQVRRQAKDNTHINLYTNINMYYVKLLMFFLTFSEQLQF